MFVHWLHFNTSVEYINSLRWCINMLMNWVITVLINSCLTHWGWFINKKASLVQIMAWCLLGTKPLSEPMLFVHWPCWNTFKWKFNQNTSFHTRKWIWECYLENVSHFVSASMCWIKCLMPNHHINIYQEKKVAFENVVSVKCSLYTGFTVSPLRQWYWLEFHPASIMAGHRNWCHGIPAYSLRLIFHGFNHL